MTRRGSRRMIATELFLNASTSQANSKIVVVPISRIGDLHIANIDRTHAILVIR